MATKRIDHQSPEASTPSGRPSKPPRLLAALLVLMIFMTGTPRLAGQAVVFGPHGTGGSYNAYQAVTAVQTWEAARLAAASRVFMGVSGRLATIQSGNENAHVASVGGPNQVWIGLTDLVSFGGFEESGPPCCGGSGITQTGAGFVWITGEPKPYQNWAPGEPNNFTPGEGAVEIRFDGLWNDNGASPVYGQSAPAVKSVIEYSVGLASAANLAAWRIDVHKAAAGNAISNLARADALIAGSNRAYVVTSYYTHANMEDNGGAGDFGDNPGVVGVREADDFAVQGTGFLTVRAGQEGAYVFRGNSDDGQRLRIDLNRDGAFAPSEAVLLDDVLSAPHNVNSAPVALTVGSYRIEWTWFERGFGAEGELSASREGGPFIVLGNDEGGGLDVSQAPLIIPPSTNKVAKWSQPPGYLFFTNAPQMRGGDRASDFDWVALMAGGSTNPPPLDQAYIPPGSGPGSIFSGVGGEFQKAQTFTCGLTGLLSQVDLLLSRSPSTTQGLVMQVRATTGGVPTATNVPPLGSLVVAPSAVGTSPGFVPIDVRSLGIQVTTGQVLAVTLSSAGSYSWVGRDQNPYAGGAHYFRSSSTPNWTTLSSADVGFRTYVTTGAPPAVQTNWVVADDFVSDGRPIDAVRWWGSYLPGPDRQFEDGFVLSFFADVPVSVSNAFSRPGALLGAYVAPASAVRAANTYFTGLDGEYIWQYEVDLRDTCLDQAVASLATPTAFLEQSNNVYWLSVAAEVGREAVPVRDTNGVIVDCGSMETGKRALGHFWGWHTSPTNWNDASATGRLTMSDTNWIYGNWTSNGLFYMELDQAFELLTTNRPAVEPGEPPRLNIARGGSEMALSWPNPSTGFKLQAAVSLSPPIVWHDIGVPPVIEQTNKKVRIRDGGATRFFRLLNSRVDLLRVEPSRITGEAGTTVYFFGEGFEQGDVLRIDGVALVNQTVVNGTLIQATLPALGQGFHTVDLVRGAAVSPMATISNAIEAVPAASLDQEAPKPPPAAPGTKTVDAGKGAPTSGSSSNGYSYFDVFIELEIPFESPQKPTSSPHAGVHPFSGEFHQEMIDFRIPGRGLDFIWARTYQSRIGQDTAQGAGWDHSYNIYIEPVGQNILLHDGNSRRDVYYQQPDGTYARDEFFREGRLAPGGAFVLTFPDTGTWEFHPLDGSPRQGKIARIADRNGNALTFAYDAQGRLMSITDTLSRNIAVAYNTDGFITSVTDFTGRRVSYAYYQNADAGGSFGDLKSVTSPIITGTPNGNDYPTGKVTSYTYSKGFGDARLNHNLLTITDAKGQTSLRNTYDSNDRVIRQAWGNATDIVDLVFVPQIPDPANNYAMMKTILNDRVGNVKEYSYDSRNRLVLAREYTGRAIANQPTTETQNRPSGQLRPGDPSYFETRYEYNADSLPTRIVYPNGNSVELLHELEYDPWAARRSRGNVRYARQLPGALSGAQAEIVQQFDYHSGFNFLTQHIDGRGNVTGHSYDARGNRLQTVHRLPSIVENWEYNSFGQVTAHVLPDNGGGWRRRDESTYYASGVQRGYLQAESVDRTGFNLTTTFNYDAVGNVVRRFNPRGFDTIYTLNALDQIVRELSPEVVGGSGIRYEKLTWYDANNNVVRVDMQNRDATGTIQPNAYFSTIYEYEILDRQTRVAQEKGSASIGNTILSYNAIPVGLRPEFIVTDYSYDANRNRTLLRHGEAVNGNQPGNTVSLIYDERDLAFREVRAAAYADQSTSQYDYDGNGNLSARVTGMESGAHMHNYAYDGYNRLVRLHDPMGNVIRSVYDLNGNRVSQRFEGELIDVPGSAQNVRLSEITYTYDAMDRLQRSDKAHFDTLTQTPIGDGQATTLIDYNANSQTIRTTDDHGHERLTAYDTANRKFRITDALNNTLTYRYDRNGNATNLSQINKSGIGNPDRTVTRLLAYDGLDRLVRSADQLGNSHQFSYDSRNNREIYIDARSNRIHYAYDGLSRLVDTVRDMTDSGDGSGAVIDTLRTSQTWDDSSRLVGRTDDNGNTLTYDYDALDRLVRTRYADGTFSQQALNAHGNALAAVDGNGTVVESAFDLNNRVASRSVTNAPGVEGTILEGYQYDGMSRLVSARDDDSAVTNRYDSLSQVTAEVQGSLPGGPVRTVSQSWDATGNLLQQIYPGGRRLARTYDALDRVSLIRDDPPGSPAFIANYRYFGPDRIEERDYGNGLRSSPLYDGIWRLVGTRHAQISSGQMIDDRSYGWDAMNNKIEFQNPLAPEFRSYTYDSAGRLVRSTSQFFQTDYQIDGVGNRQFVSGGPDAGSYFMDGTLPEPADAEMNQYTYTPLGQFTYDLNGNLVATPRLQMTYDYRNQLTRVVNLQTSQTISYKYDCLGRRIESDVGGNVTRFYYAAWQELEEQNAAGVSLATRVWGRELDELLEMKRGAGRYYFHGDDLGSIVKVTDASGNLVEQYRYEDYGQPRIFDAFGNFVSHSLIENPYLFTCRRYDVDTGLYQFRTRYLYSEIGRFTTRDVVGVWGDPRNVGNAFTYVGLSPLCMVDPFGTLSLAPQDPPKGVTPEELKEALEKAKETLGKLNDAKELGEAIVDLENLLYGNLSEKEKQELLKKRSWELIKKALEKAGVGGMFITALEWGWSTGSLIGNHIAAGIGALADKTTLTRAKARHEELGGANKFAEGYFTTSEGELIYYKDGIYYVARSEPTGGWTYVPIIGDFLADRKRVWKKLNE